MTKYIPIRTELLATPSLWDSCQSTKNSVSFLILFKCNTVNGEEVALVVDNDLLIPAPGRLPLENQIALLRTQSSMMVDPPVELPVDVNMIDDARWCR